VERGARGENLPADDSQHRIVLRLVSSRLESETLESFLKSL